MRMRSILAILAMAAALAGVGCGGGAQQATVRYDMGGPEEITVYKHRVSAFSGNDLQMILRSQSITQLVLFGIATSGIVLSTLRQASDLDYRCVVVKDCCFDGDEEVHRVLTEKVFAKQATVVGADDLITRMLS